MGSESATSPLITNTLWALSTAAFVLGVYVQSYQTRIVIFCALSSIIYYQLMHTSTGDPPNVSFVPSFLRLPCQGYKQLPLFFFNR